MNARQTFLLISLMASLVMGSSLAAVEPAPVEVILTPRKAVWSQKETWYFDVTVKNPSQSEVEVPYIYDGVIEIDGRLYVQFPKPKISGNPHRVVAAGAETSHGTLTLQGNFSTVDAQEGKTSLKLAAGEHQLRLSLGSHQSKRISFRVAE